MKALILNGSPRPQGSCRPGAPHRRRHLAAGRSQHRMDRRSPDGIPSLHGLYAVPHDEHLSAAPRCGPCRRRTDPAGRSARGGDSDLLGRYVGPAEDALRTARSGFHGRIGSRPSAAPAKGKRALVIAACTTPWPFNILARQSRGAVRSIREILGTGGMKVRTCEIPGTRKMNGKLSEKEARRITARTRRIVRKIE